MNNGRYATLMDLGRLDLTFRCGLLVPLVKRRWFPLVAAMTLRFRRSLELGQRYELVTRLAGFEEQSWYIEQRFVVRGETAAYAYLRGVFRGPSGNVPIADLLAVAGHFDVTSPTLTEGFRAWLGSDEVMRREQGPNVRIAAVG